MTSRVQIVPGIQKQSLGVWRKSQVYMRLQRVVFKKVGTPLDNSVEWHIIEVYALI